MPDNKNKTGAQDRSQVSADQDYEVRQFAEAHGISVDEVRNLVARVGNSREALEAALGRTEK